MNNNEQHQQAINQFIELANKLKDQGYQPQTVSAGLMTASGLYATYLYAGNEGYLHESGVQKLVRAYEKSVLELQAYKKALVEKDEPK